jgi:hypothetical protein
MAMATADDTLTMRVRVVLGLNAIPTRNVVLLQAPVPEIQAQAAVPAVVANPAAGVAAVAAIPAVAYVPARERREDIEREADFLVRLRAWWCTVFIPALIVLYGLEDHKLIKLDQTIAEQWPHIFQKLLKHLCANQHLQVYTEFNNTRRPEVKYDNEQVAAAFLLCYEASPKAEDTVLLRELASLRNPMGAPRANQLVKNDWRDLRVYISRPSTSPSAPPTSPTW